MTIIAGRLLTPWLMRHASGRTLIVADALIAAAGFAWQSRIDADGGYLAGILGPAIVLSFGGGLLNRRSRPRSPPERTPPRPVPPRV
ncbi:hypothetical protein ACWEV3_33240 [Saccharopolyspora sp. NPDC003752]